VYKQYFLSLGGKCFIGGFGLVSILLELTITATNLWVAAWSSDPSSHAHQKLLIYLGLGVASALFSIVRNFWWFHATYLASKRLHERMLASVLRAPMSWFNTTPQVSLAPFCLGSVAVLATLCPAL
jgi:ATP-binding cassette subfamily C (CFTR/MRP) protein 1